MDLGWACGVGGRVVCEWLGPPTSWPSGIRTETLRENVLANRAGGFELAYRCACY